MHKLLTHLLVRKTPFELYIYLLVIKKKLYCFIFTNQCLLLSEEFCVVSHFLCWFTYGLQWRI